MRQIREIPMEEENFHLEVVNGFTVPRRDPVEPEPIGTIVLLPFRVIGYDQDCDRSLMARLANLTLFKRGELIESGWDASNIGLYPGDGFVVTEEELLAMFEQE